MEEHERLYQKSVKDREDLLMHNQALQRQLAEVKAASSKESNLLKKNVVQAKVKQVEDDQKSSNLTE